MLQSKSLVEKGDSCTGVKQSKDHLTILVACSLSGECLPLLVIGKSKAPRCFRGIKNLPTEYNHSKKAWMPISIFEEWIHKLYKKIKQRHHIRSSQHFILYKCFGRQQAQTAGS